jgi:hypothetical protein
MTKAKHDPLLAALIAKLPIETEHWPRDNRIAWLRMMALAFDVVYGPCGGVLIAPDEAHDRRRAGETDEAATAPHSIFDDVGPPRPPHRFYVDHDGFAMGDGRPIAMEDLPADATLWDERTGMECGDVAAILWRDIGTTRRSLPLGVILKPAFEAT